MAEYLDIIFLLILVVVIFSRLKNVLGTDSKNAKIVVMPKEQFEKVYQEMKKNNMTKSSDVIDLDKLSPLDRELVKIPNFNKDSFIKGGQRAFEMILSAFSKGDSKALTNLLCKDLLKKFNEVINQRKEEGIVAETDLIGFVETNVQDVKFKGNKVNLVVKFVSEQVNILKNSEGEVIEGDENYVQTVSDVWTFEKSLDANTNNWLLCSTKK